MSKPVIRINDIVTNSTHGNGQVITGNPLFLLDGQPVACEENEVSYPDGTHKKIVSGQACVSVNGRKIALQGDHTEDEGILNSSTNTLIVGEGELFIFLNTQISINRTTVHFTFFQA